MIETLLKPGNSYRVKYDGQQLKRDDVIDIFCIERGSLVLLYGCYCPDKNVWEYLDSSNFL